MQDLGTCEAPAEQYVLAGGCSSPAAITGCLETFLPWSPGSLLVDAILLRGTVCLPLSPPWCEMKSPPLVLSM